MPYIKKEDRSKFDLDNIVPETEGELNYVITRLCHNYLKAKGIKYASLNSVIGVLSCAQLELYRQIVAPYENKKIQENGDVSLSDN